MATIKTLALCCRSAVTCPSVIGCAHASNGAHVSSASVRMPLSTQKSASASLTLTKGDTCPSTGARSFSSLRGRLVMMERTKTRKEGGGPRDTDTGAATRPEERPRAGAESTRPARHHANGGRR